VRRHGVNDPPPGVRYSGGLLRPDHRPQHRLQGRELLRHVHRQAARVFASLRVGCERFERFTVSELTPFLPLLTAIVVALTPAVKALVEWMKSRGTKPPRRRR
jgi:hypothetical protein